MVDIDDVKRAVEGAFAARDAAERAAIVAARTNSAVFAALILRDEKTNRRIEMAPMHHEWHEAADRHENIILRAWPGSGKTQSLVVAKTVHAIGVNPRLRVGIASASEAPAIKRAKAIASYIESPTVRRVFPDLEPGRKWAPDSGVLEVKRDGVITDPTVQCIGLEHGNILGARLDLAEADDVLTPDNTRTPHQREKVLGNIRSKLLSRSPERFWFFANTFDPDDAAHVFQRENAQNPDWWFGDYAVKQKDGTLTWPKIFDAARLEREHDRFGPLLYAQLFENQARDAATQVFKREYLANALRRGEGKHMKYGGFMSGKPPAGYTTFTGVDLATSTSASSDLRAIVTIAIYPDHRSWEILCVESGRWSGPELVERISETNKRFSPVAIDIENNGAQDFLRQWAARDLVGVPIRGSATTSKNKHDVQFGIEALANEFYNDNVVMPNFGGRMHPEMEALYNELFYYSPQMHSGDRLIALWKARSVARSAIATTAPKLGVVTSLGLNRR